MTNESQYRPKVLVVEDEMLIGLALADDLQDHGFDVIGPFPSSGEAMASLELDTPDLAFLDVNLGTNKTSFELAEELSERRVPFAFLTGYSELAPMMERFAEVTYLSKPVSLPKALAEAKRLLGEDNDT